VRTAQLNGHRRAQYAAALQEQSRAVKVQAEASQRLKKPQVQMRTICAVARNGYSRERLQEDFREGISEVGGGVGWPALGSRPAAACGTSCTALGTPGTALLCMPRRLHSPVFVRPSANTVDTCGAAPRLCTDLLIADAAAVWGPGRGGGGAGR
jgi:hypothetical protein